MRRRSIVERRGSARTAVAVDDTLRLHVAAGPAAETIGAHAADINADLIVMGRSGRFMHLGSTAVRLLRHADRALLIVPPTPSAQTNDLEPFVHKRGLPVALNGWQSVTVSLIAGVVTFVWHSRLERLHTPVLIPTVLRKDFYALAALAGAGIVVAGPRLHLPPTAATMGGAALCFAARLAAIRSGWGLPTGSFRLLTISTSGPVWQIALLAYGTADAYSGTP